MSRPENFQVPCNYGVAVGGGADGTTYIPPLRRLYVGGAGNVAITTAGGQTVTLTAVPVGTTIIGVAISKVMSTNTTATLLVGFR
jgi:hypothetical protein